MYFGNKISIVKKGLDREEGTKTFYLSDSSVISSFSKKWIDSVKNGRFSNYNWSKTQEVEMTTLDSLISQFGLPKFIKIDVEGYEVEVLQGLTNPIDIISFEYTVPEQTSNIESCLRQIEKFNANIECNFSVTESMTFELDSWISVEGMNQLIRTEKFISTGFGDIYVKDINCSIK